MTTVREVASKATAALDSELADAIVGDWVRERVAEVFNALPLDQRKEEAEFVLQALVSTSGATFTQDSNSVTLDATAQAALAGKVLPGDELRIASARQRYRVVAYLGTSIEITPDFQEATPTASSTIEVFRRLYDLPADCRQVESVINSQIWMKKVTREFLNQRYPDRRRDATYPRFWAPHGYGPSGRRQIEFYPPPRSNDVVVRMTYLSGAADYALDDELPEFFDLAELKVGVMVDICKYEASRLARMSEEKVMKDQIQAAEALLAASQTWLNAASRHLSVWERVKDRLIAKADMSYDEGQITRLKGPGTYYPDKIRTAKDHVDDLGQDL